MYALHNPDNLDLTVWLSFVTLAIFGFVLVALGQNQKIKKATRAKRGAAGKKKLNNVSRDPSLYRNNTDESKRKIDPEDAYLSGIDFSTESPALVKTLMTRLTTRGKEIYTKEVADAIEPEDYGNFVAIHIATHDFAIASEHSQAAKILRSRNPEGQIFVLEISPPPGADNAHVRVLQSVRL